MALTLVSLGGFLTAFVLPVLVWRSSLKTTIAGWSCLSLAGAALLTLWPAHGVATGVGLMALLSTIGMLHPLVMAQGRGLIPPAARGRGLGLLNTFVSRLRGSVRTFGLIADFGHHDNRPVAGIYSSIFLCAGIPVALALLVYLRSPLARRS